MGVSMNIEVLDNPEQEIIDYLNKKIADFNWAHWEVSERSPLAVQIKNDQGEIIAGAAARSFGDWLLLDTLWVSDELRGQNIGSEILKKIEASGKKRGCIKCLLDTLNFQAMPFYEKHGYKTQWVQQGYPKTGCKYFMVKEL
jgi:GNAT superfamily N-acetyltransferase